MADIKRPASGDPNARRYSRRHDTDGPHMAAREGRTRPHRHLARVMIAELHAEVRAGRTDAQQLALLDTRPGDSLRERARLQHVR